MSMRTGESLIFQGSESIIYKSPFFPLLGSSSQPDHQGTTRDIVLPACIRKHRPRKTYRHPVLDDRLTRHRILSESRLLAKCLRSGIRVPRVWYVDERRGDLYLEYLVGQTVRDFLFSLSTIVEGEGSQARSGEQSDRETALERGEEERTMAVMRMIGVVIRQCHDADIMHGDLTTSNLFLLDVSPSSGSNECQDLPKDKGDGTGQICMIDFGLGMVTSQAEDKAIDLYVLERAFLSTHPRSTALYAAILAAYFEFRPTGKSEEVKRKLESVRLRGRKRTMVG